MGDREPATSNMHVTGLRSYWLFFFHFFNLVLDLYADT
jgi:hypothetical protein